MASLQNHAGLGGITRRENRRSIFKVYIRDSGLFHALLGIEDLGSLQGHPKLGASWEGFALETLLTRIEERYAFFWATHGGAEMDLCVMKGRRRTGIEFKYTSAPAVTRSMRSALEDLKLDNVFVVYPGTEEFPLAPRVTAIGLNRIVEQAPSTLSV